MPIPFAKYAACGNDFILFDHRIPFLDLAHREPIARLCHRQKGIGADGMVILENSETADFRMRIFNSDGSEAEMCGNGIRCLTKFILELIPSKKRNLSIETMNQKIEVSLNEDHNHVNAHLLPPSITRFFISLPLDSKIFTVHFLDTGVPHTVIFVEHIEGDYLSIAPQIRFHPQFHPKGTNVDFVQVLSKNSISVRTYERGVEQETLACGTGAVASALAAAKIHHLQSPITVHTRSQESLLIAFDDRFQNLNMAGPANKVYQGEIVLEKFGFRLIH